MLDIETTWTAEEFAAAAQMAAFVNCDGCGKKIPGDAAIEWNSGQQVYCSESCLIRDTAPLIKPQPRTTGPAELEGWTW